MNVEETKVFKYLLKLFIKESKKNSNTYQFTEADIFTSIEMYREFYDFCMFNALSGKFVIKGDNQIILARIKALLDDFRHRYSYHVRMSTRYYDEIIKKLGLEKHDLETRRKMLKFNTAYHMIKQVFSGMERSAVDEFGHKDRCFEHLKGTMEIVLRELPNPNINKIIIALLHDVKEDIPGITFSMLKRLFGKKIVKGIKKLTKRDWKEFLRETDLEKIKFYEDRGLENIEEHEKEIYSKLLKLGKERRNELYFGDLEKLEEDDLYVKFADRIHNLRTLKGMSDEHIVKKIIETEKYFLEVAYREKMKSKGVCKAYDLLQKEIDELKNYISISDLYNKEVVRQNVSINMKDRCRI
ncbi:MAG: hypothetical protein PHN31_00800 [Candidatus Gracilibacteria bacterium]|nr:hypothetical protein [Candidatus Gracilibacteria bacterium]